MPRSAAVEGEILAGANDENPEFAVYPVTRAFMPVLGSWPTPQAEPSDGWINHSHSPSGADIRIRPFDTVDITVWDSEANSLLTSETDKVVDISGVRVTEAGTIFVPYIGYLRVADRTPDSARRLVEEEMAAIIPSAQVQLAVAPGTRGSVTLVGGVGRPGTVPLPESHFTVLNLIGQGGGPTELRNPQVRLIRNGRTYLASYESLLENPARDAILQGGDRVALVEDDRFFRALGAAGQQTLIYFEDETVNALDAMSLMGGVNERRGNLRGILVLREYPSQFVRTDLTGPSNERAIFAIDLSTADGLFSAGAFRILPGDTVLATESVLTSAEGFAVLIGTFVGLSNTLGN
ncbi:MAG: polysaccharide biosynthesis/export family protein [Pseudomonadota bacterium]